MNSLTLTNHLKFWAIVHKRNPKTSILFFILGKYAITNLEGQPTDPQLKAEKKAVHNKTFLPSSRVPIQHPYYFHQFGIEIAFPRSAPCLSQCLFNIH